jgi:protein SCO1/2
MNVHWNWRLAPRLSVITLTVLVVVVVILWQQRLEVGASVPNTSNSVSADGLVGTDLGGVAAPSFMLTDQFGQQVSLAQSTGKPVVLAFLYTHCPDVCPLTAEKLHSTLQLLGSKAQQVSVLAVSTDPTRDDVAAALTFSKQHNMQNEWHFLVGKRAELEPIWSGYNIFVQTQQGVVNHSMGLYVIDKQGKQRIYLDNDFTPSQLAGDLQKLL